MSVRRSPSVYAITQATEISVKRRRRSTNGSHSIHTATLTPHDGGFLLLPAPSSQPRESYTTPSSLTLAAQKLRQSMVEWRRSTVESSVQHAALGFDALCGLRDQRVELLRNLSNPWPVFQQPNPPTIKASVQSDINTEPVPHAVFRDLLENAGQAPKVIRRILRNQLLHCETPRDILRVVACVMQKRERIEQLKLQQDQMMRAIYRCRNKASDPEVLHVLGIVISRFLLTDIPVPHVWVHLAVKFSARCRTVRGMRRYLMIMKQLGYPMNGDLFRSIIGKCSIGHRGLGEIRNGRWMRQDLLQVLTGFEEERHLPENQKCHLETFLCRSNWQYVHGWVAILARCRADEAVWREWQTWKLSAASQHPQKLYYLDRELRITSRSRGEMWFVEQMTYSGNLQLAWRIFHDSNIQFQDLRPHARYVMLNAPEHVRCWDETMRQEMLVKYEIELTNIEAALGVRWTPPNTPGAPSEGQHEMIEDREDVLERLADPDWQAVTDHGYPYADQPLVPENQRALHNACEASPSLSRSSSPLQVAGVRYG